MPLRLALRRASCVVVLAFHLAGLGPGFPRGSRGAEDPRTVGQAQSEIERLLEQSTLARKRADLGTAAKLAAQALELAGQRLRDDDPLQVRAVIAHSSLLCDEAKRRGNLAGALSIAGKVAAFAAERGDFQTAVQWTKYARDVLAKPRFPAGDPTLTAIEFALAKFETYDAMLRVRDRERAFECGQRAVALGRKSLPPGNPNRDQVLMLFADIAFWRGDDEAALKLCEEVEEETGKKPEGNANNRVEALIRKAGLLAMGAGPISQDLAPRLADALRRAFGDRVATSCEFLSRLVFRDSRRARALDELDRGAPIEAVEGRLARDLGRFESILRDAGVSPAVAALGGIQVALFQLRTGRIAAAEETFKKLEWAIKDPGVTPKSAGDYWINRGVIEIERANYDVGRQDFEIALKLKATPLQEAQALNNLGDLLLRQGDYQAAAEHLERSIALYSGSLQYESSHALALRNLADVRDRLGRAGEAGQFRTRAIAIAEAAVPHDPYAVYLCRNSLGNGLYSQGEFAAARIEFEKSREISLKAFGASHFHVAEAEVNLGWIALAESRPADAAASFQNALTIFRAALGAEHPRIAEVLGYVARVHASEGQIDQAKSDLDAALTLRQRLLDWILRSSFSERDRLALVQELRVHPEASAWPGVLDTYLDLAPGLGIADPEQYRRILTWKGVLARHAPPRVDELEEDAEIRRLARAREELLPKLRNATFLDSRGEQARTLEAEVDALERKLRERSRQFSRDDPAAAPGLAEVAAALPARTALLDVIEIRRYRPRKKGEPLSESLRYLAMLVRGDRPPVRIDLGDAARLDDQMKAFLANLAARGEAGAADLTLGQAIRSPLIPYLEGIEALIVSADGLLGRLPLGALPGRRPGTFWVDELAFSSVPSAQSLIDRRRSAHPANAGALIVGGVDYGAVQAAAAGDRPPLANSSPSQGPGPRQTRSRVVTRWPPLGETLKEAQAVARAFEESHPGAAADLLTGDRATKEALRRHLAQRRLVHLATHGLFDADREPSKAFDTVGISVQFDSYIVLADANRRGVDALLTAEEMSRLDLRGVDLVVLSACQSGLGHIRAGQGDVGLLGALDRAGARAVVSSLWEVSDAATNALMQAFYRHLWSSPGEKGPAWALRAAQRDMIQGTVRARDGGSFAQPTDWAAFVLGGDPAAPVRP